MKNKNIKWIYGVTVISLILISFLLSPLIAKNIQKNRNEKIYGVVYLDKNKNRVKDKGEVGLLGVTVILYTGEETHQIVTNKTGYFEFFVSRFTYKKILENGSLFIKRRTLPKGGRPLRRRTRIKEYGEVNIPVFYKAKVYDLFSKIPDETPRRKYRVELFDGSKNTLIQADLDKKAIFFNRKAYKFPQAKLIIPKAINLDKEPIFAHFLFKKYGKRIVSRALLIKDYSGKVLAKKDFKYKMDKYDIQHKLSQGVYFIQGKFKLDDGTIFLSDSIKFFILKKNDQKYLLKPRAENFSFPFDVEIGSFQTLVDEAKKTKGVVVISYAKTEKVSEEEPEEKPEEKPKEGFSEEDSEADKNDEEESEDKDDESEKSDTDKEEGEEKDQDENDSDEDLEEELKESEKELEEADSGKKIVSIESIDTYFYSRVLKRYLVQNGLKPEKVIIKSSNLVKGKNLKVELFNIKTKDKDIRKYLIINKKPLRVNKYGRTRKTIKPTYIYRVEAGFSDGSRLKSRIKSIDLLGEEDIIYNEKIEHSVYKGYWDYVDIKYSGKLKDGNKIYLNKKEIFVDRERKFFLTLKVFEGENKVKFYIKNTTNNTRQSIVKIFKVNTLGPVLYVTVSKFIEKNFNPTKKELVVLESKRDVKVDIDGEIGGFEEGQYSFQRKFQRGDNYFRFALTKNKKTLVKDLVIYVDDLKDKPKTFLTFEGEYQKYASKLNGKSAWAGTGMSGGIYLGFMPFAHSSEKRSDYIRNILVTLHAKYGTLSLANDAGTSEISAKPMSYGLSFDNYFSVYEPSRDSYRPFFGNLFLSPHIGYEQFSLSPSTGDIKLTYGVGWLGFRFKSELRRWSSFIELGYKASVYSSVKAVSNYEEVDVKSMTMTDSYLEWEYKFTKGFGMGLKYNLESIKMKYGSGVSDETTKTKGQLRFKFYF